MSESSFQPKTLNNGHDAIMMWLIANPHRTLKECAAELGYASTQYVRMIVQSDMFQAKYERICREQNIEAAHLSERLGQKLQRMTHSVIDRLTERVEMGIMDDKTLTNVAKLGLTSLGYGTAAPATVTTTTNVFVDSEVLRAAQQRLLTRQPSPNLPATLELEAVPVES